MIINNNSTIFKPLNLKKLKILKLKQLIIDYNYRHKLRMHLNIFLLDENSKVKLTFLTAFIRARVQEYFNLIWRYKGCSL